MLANMIRDASNPAISAGKNSVLLRYPSRNWDEVKIPPQSPRTPNAIIQILRLRKALRIDLRSFLSVLSRGITIWPMRTEIKPSTPPIISPTCQLRASITITQTNRPKPPPILKQLIIGGVLGLISVLIGQIV